MGITVSLLMAAAGAILLWAMHTSTEHTIGLILLIVGVVGFVTSLAFWSSWGGFGSRKTTVVQRDRIVS